MMRFDLNLLKTLAIVGEERSVQRAAMRLRITPSAVSHALGRLRHALQDPLFIRTKGELVPTPRCRATLIRLRPLLVDIDHALGAGLEADRIAFDPASTRRDVTLVLPGALELSLLPPLMGRLAEKAPLWTLSVRGLQRRSYEADLLSGEADVVLSVGGHTPSKEGLLIATLWEDELVVLQGPDGPLPTNRSVTLDDLVDIQQVYSVPWPRTQNYLDIKLSRAGRQRAIAVELPGYSALGDILQTTGFVAAMPDRTALALLRRFESLSLIRISPTTRMPLSIEMSTRFHASPEGRWLRQQIDEVAADVPSLSESPDGTAST
ncbi:LysR family transcriptional regulator [Aliihoeflea aestuarii]|uniref:LysR family transcriptional regulator n=1 Tax=Aliihoeflea aestuarii TaxID=453840 RepID=UPI002094EA1F|nr:LysR family transcriptional regulator [Aliihoeflea aestuarii]MCO6392045.1 LysR family transcriptional regulator [Aliihoeflea aestuarii]